MNARSPLLLAVLLLCFAPSIRAHAQSAALAIIVHPSNPAAGLSDSEVEELFLGTRLVWADGTPVVILLPGAGTPARRRMLRRIYRMSESEYRQYWIGRMYRTEVPVTPRELPDCEASVRLVSRTRGAIAIVPNDCVREGVQVLSVNDHEPGQAEYLYK